MWSLNIVRASTDGIKLAQWAREHCPDTHIILTSACFPNGSAAEAFDDIAFHPKPYQPEHVADLLRTELDKETTGTVPDTSAGASSESATINVAEASRITVIAAWRQGTTLTTAVDQSIDLSRAHAGIGANLFQAPRKGNILSFPARITADRCLATGHQQQI